MDQVQDYFERKELEDLDVQELAREKFVLQPVKQTDSMRMEVSSPKLAIGVRGKQEVAEADCYRHHILLKLLFAIVCLVGLRIVFKNYMNQVNRCFLIS